MIDGYKVIGLCIARCFEGPCYNFVMYLNESLVKYGYRLFVYNGDIKFVGGKPVSTAENRIYEMLPFNKLDALVVCEESFQLREVPRDIIARATQSDIPVFVFGDYYEGCTQLRFDYASGFEKLLRHVIEEHHVKKPHFISGIPNNAFAEEREAVFAKVLRDNNIEFNKNTMVSYGYFWFNSARTAVEKLFKNEKLPDAIVCANDVMAMAACEVVKEHGLKVPEDIIVSGMDGIDNIYYTEPQITSVKCEEKDMAQSVADAINERLETGKCSQKLIMVEPKFIIMESCGCNIHHDTDANRRENEYAEKVNQFIDNEFELLNLAYEAGGSKDIEHLNMRLNTAWMSNMALLVVPECVDDEYESVLDLHNAMPDKLICVYDNDNGEVFQPRVILREDIMPGIDRYISRELPIFFNGIASRNGLLGFLCYHSEWINIDNVRYISQMAMMMRVALIGFKSSRTRSILKNNMVDMYKTDELTGFYQRKVIEIEFTRMLEEAQRDDGSLGLFLVDVDYLNSINELHGHEEGDKVIAAVAEALNKVMPRGTVLARYGGDELLCLFKPSSKTKKLHNHFYDELDRYNKKSGNPYQTSASVGVIVSKDLNNISLKSMVDKALIELNKEKELKRKD